MDDALGDTLVIEMLDLLPKDEVFEQSRSARTGFQGVLIADDIGMKALKGSLADNAAATLAAGCDLTLHCSGNLAEMQAVAPAVHGLTEDTVGRLASGTAWMGRHRTAFDIAAEHALLLGLTA